MRAYKQDRGLYAGVIRRAFLDYACGVVSPLSGDQRLALNAYWWIMSHPFYLPKKVKEDPKNGIPDIICGDTSRWMTRPEFTYTDAGITLQKIVEPTPPGDLYYPSVEHGAPFEVFGDQSFMTFEMCCAICGLDIQGARNWLHLVRPDETPTATHYRNLHKHNGFSPEHVDRLLHIRIHGRGVTQASCCDCQKVADGVSQVDKEFGFRRMRVVSGKFVYRRQSRCRKCRARYTPKKT